MKLYIDTIKNNNTEVELRLGDEVKKCVSVEGRRTEKTLEEIDKLLQENDLSFLDLSEVKVNNDGGSFTSLRIGVVIANTLGYCLNIPVRGMNSESQMEIDNLRIVRPIYDKEPNIG